MTHGAWYSTYSRDRVEGGTTSDLWPDMSGIRSAKRKRRKKKQKKPNTD